MRASRIVTVLLLLSAFAMVADVTTSGYVSPQITPSFTFFPSFTFKPSFTFTFPTTTSSTHMFTFFPSFTFIFSSTTSFTPTLPPATAIVPKTDWAILGIEAIPPNPQAGDFMVFSMSFAPLSSNVPFPHSVYIQCQVDGFGCGAGVISHPGPIGAARIVSSSDYWQAAPGPHILTWFIDTSNDPNPSNNIMSIQFFVQPAQAPMPTTQTMMPTQTIAPTTQPVSTQQVTVVQTSVQTVTPTTSTAGGFLPIQGDTLPLVVTVGLLIVIILVITQRKRTTGAAGGPSKPAA